MGLIWRMASTKKNDLISAKHFARFKPCPIGNAGIDHVSFEPFATHLINIQRLVTERGDIETEFPR